MERFISHYLFVWLKCGVKRTKNVLKKAPLDGVGNVSDELHEERLGHPVVLGDVADHFHYERVLVVEGPLHQHSVKRRYFWAFLRN